jgi:hypothetical protein
MGAKMQSLNVEGYELLDDVLARAYRQAAAGKGMERHAAGEPFHEQPMQSISDLVGVGFCIGQAIKKSHESQRLPRDMAVAELLGAINYLAGAVIFIERSQQVRVPANDNERPLPLVSVAHVCEDCTDSARCAGVGHCQHAVEAVS